VIELLNMDCMEYMKGLEDNAFDLAIVDPPYGIKRLSVNENRDPNSKFRRSMAAMVESAKGWNGDKPTDEYWRELFRVSVEQIVWGANNFTMPQSEYFCIWDKFQTVDNFASAEYAWVSGNKWKKPAKVFRHQIHGANPLGKIHPTQKPVKLYEWLLSNYAKEGDKILDTHLGSGSSAIAAHYGGFDFVGMELDPDYYKAAKERFNNETKQIDLLGGLNA
jgi:site-specific DNA-methyltransferase (adenine-specific)